MSASNGGGTPSAGPTIITVNCADIDLTKVADNSVVDAGDDIGYLITVFNNDDGLAHGVSVTDNLPVVSGVVWSIDEAGTDAAANCTLVGNALSCAVGDLAENTSLQVHVVSDTTGDSCGTMLNDVSAGSTNDGSAEVLDVPITVNCAEIDIEKTAGSATVNAGDEVTYTITVTNDGDGEARDVVVTDTLPTNAGLDWTVTVSPEGAGTCDTDSVPMTCDLGTIAAGDTVTITLTSPTDATTCDDNVIENTASVRTSNDGSDTSDADVEAEGDQPTTITVNCAEIDIEKTAGAATVNAGDNVTYTITVTNDGDGEAHDVVVTDTLPTNAGLDWTVTVSPEGAGTCDTDSVPMTCDLGTIDSGDTVTITLTSPTDATTCADNVIENTASVRTSNDGSDTSDADVEAEGDQPTTITVNCAEIDIEKTAGAATVNAGDNVTYTITVTNDGDGEARDVVVTDTLPTNAGLDWTVTVSPEAQGPATPTRCP